MKITTLPYFGQINAIISKDSRSLFTVRNQPLLYQLDSQTEHPVLNYLTVPVAMENICALADGTVLLIGKDGHFYQSDWLLSKITQISKKSTFEFLENLDQNQSYHAVALKSFEDKIAILYPHHLLIFTYQKHKLGDCLVNMRLDTPLAENKSLQKATSLAVSADSEWLVIGDTAGFVASFYFNPERTALLFSSCEQLHQGAVNDLCFEPIAQQFFSAGADKQLLRTHAQGKLHGIGRAKGSQHSEMIRTLLVTDKRLYTGSDDKSVKSWQFDKGQPNTCKEGLIKFRFLSHCIYQQQPSILAVGTDQSLRFIAIDEDGKLGEVSHIVKDGYQKLKELLEDSDNKTFEDGLTLLNSGSDNERLQLVSELLNKTTDGYRSEQLASWLATSPLEKAIGELEKLIGKHRSEKVRQIAFDALAKRVSDNPLRHLQLALDSQFVDINKLAIDGYLSFALENPSFVAKILPILEKTLNHKQYKVAIKALIALEKLFADDDPKANLMAIASENAEIQQVGLVRLYQRDFLQHFEVKRQLTLLQYHENGALRATAFHLLVLAEPNLAQTVLALDEELATVAQTFTDFDLSNYGVQAVKNVKKSKKTVNKNLSDDELEPLLQGLANPFGGISIASARLLALLNDKRAFGVLVRLMTDDNQLIRLGVAKAFGELTLAENLAILPTLFDDNDETVRQTAMQSYGKLVKQLKLPILQWVSAGFASKKADIHQQALSILLQEFHNDKQPDDIQAVLIQALNNPFENIRQEVVKVLLNNLIQKDKQKRQIDDNFQLFALLKHSQFADVHQVALDEWQALLKQNTLDDTTKDRLNQLLAEFLSSPFDSVRQSAFDIAKSQAKRIELKTLLSLAIHSSAVSMRKQALELLDSKKSPELLPLVSHLFNDENHGLRLLALNLALEASDVALLQQALQSPYDDIQLATATALAKQGEKQSFAIFEKFLSQPVPQLADDIKQWNTNVEKSLLGMAQLKDERGFDWFVKFLLDSNYSFANNLALASELYWVARPEHLPTLRQLQTHDNTNIRQAVNLALCVWGDTSGDVILQSHKSSALKTKELLVAPIGLGMPSANIMARFINNTDTSLASQFLLTVYDVLQNPEQPKRLIASLSFIDNMPAVFFANVLSHYADKDKVWQTLVDKINETMHQATYYLTHNDKNAKNWAITVEDVQLLANCAVFGSPLLKASVVELLQRWQDNCTFNTWQSHLQVFKKVHQNAIHDLPKLQETPDVKAQEYGWQAVAFGAYVGVLRKQAIGSETAIHALANFAKTYPTWQDSVQRALLPLLHADAYYIRYHVWEKLLELQTSSDILAQQAIISPYVEIVKNGLELLVKNLNSEQVDKQLQQYLQTNSPILAEQSYQHLLSQKGALLAGEMALQSYSLELRHQVVQSWQQVTHADKLADKIQFLTLASNNDDWQTRFEAIDQLFRVDYQSVWLDKAIELWQNANDVKDQDWVARMLYRFSAVIGKQADDCLKVLALLDNPYRKVELLPIYNTLAHTRSVALVEPLLARFVEKPQERKHIGKTLLTISGFDQPIYDYQDEFADKSWLEKQYPRHVDVLLKLAEMLIKTTNYAEFVELLTHLAWANDEAFNHQIDDLLQKSYRQLPQNFTANIVKAMSHRAEKRSADLAGLRLALANKDPIVQFLSAESLAKRGNKDGFAILMATIDYQTDGDLRRRAVLALGELADEQAFDKLLKLANDKEHYLQDVASEALGHLGNSEYGQQIFAMLSQQLANFEYSNPAIIHIINGLRWLDTFESWQQIRNFVEKCHQDNNSYRSVAECEHAVQLMRYHTKDDDILQVNKQFILKYVKSNLCSVAYMAYDTAKILFGNDKETVYPYDWQVLLGPYPNVDDYFSLKRISQFAGFDELLSFIAEFNNEIIYRNYNDYLNYFDKDDDEFVLQTLNQAVLKRQNMPIERLQTLLSADNVNQRKLALSYLSQYPSEYWLADVEKNLWQQWHTQQQNWQNYVAKVSQQPNVLQDDDFVAIQKDMIIVGEKLLWLLGRFATLNKGNQSQLADMFAWLLKQQTLEAVQGLAPLADTLQSWLKQLLLALLARTDDDLQKLTGLQDIINHTKHWSDLTLQQLVQILCNKIAKSQVVANNTNPYEQLMMWVQQGDLSALATWANDTKLDESLRISAIEALGQLPLTLADEVLATLSELQQHDADEDIKKSAFGALRRYQRRLQPKVRKYSNNVNHNLT